MTRLFVENRELDLSQVISQQITYAIDDIRKVEAKSTSFSKTITLPGTAKNNLALGQIYYLNNSNFTNDNTTNIGYNFNAAKSANAVLMVDNYTVMKGVMRLMEVVIDKGSIEYQVVLFGELGGFIFELGNKRLQDLDFSAYNHTWNLANITSSWNNGAAGSGYYYGLIDYGQVSTDKISYDVKAFRPCLFVKEYLDKIFEGTSYTYECALFDTTRFKSLKIPHNQQKLLRLSTDALKVSDGTRSYSGIGFTFNLDFPTIQVQGNFTNFSNEEFTYNVDAKATVSANIVVNGTYTKDSINTITIELKRNSDTLTTDTYTTGTSGSISIDKTVQLTLNKNDIIYVLVTVDSLTDSIDLTGSAINIAYDVAQKVDVAFGESLVINDILPQNILQKDFFASILKLFNLYVNEDKFEEKKLIIKPYVDYYSGDVVDWSDIVDRSKAMTIKPMSELNGRFYEFKFKDDSDYYNDLYKKRYNETYGTYISDTQYEWSKDKQTIELIFSPTPLIQYQGTDKYVSAILKKNNDNEEQIDSNIRILLGTKQTGVASWSIKNGVTTLGTYTEYPYIGHLDNPTDPNNDLNFGAPKEFFANIFSDNLNVNQFNVYYSPYMAEIIDKDSRLLTCYVWLKDLDVYRLDFSKFIFIDGALFRLAKVIDYTPNGNEVTKVELLRVINTVY